MRILMVRLGAMGDVVQTLPAARELRRRFPRAKIDWAVDAHWADLLIGNPHIDQVIRVPMRALRRRDSPLAAARKALGLIGGLRKSRFDIAFDFQGLIKSAALASMSGASRTVGFSRESLREPAAEVFYSRRASTSMRHVVDRYRDLASPGSGASPPNSSAFPLPDGGPLGALPGRYVLASPQAGWGSKQWPPEYYAELATLLLREFGIPLLADFAPGQEHRARVIRSIAAEGSVVPHSSSILGLISATRRATAVVGVDSGPMHLAAALDRPGVAIFGPTEPRRNGPRSPLIEVIRAPGALTTYKRDAQPSPSMLACAPRTVLSVLAPILAR